MGDARLSLLWQPNSVFLFQCSLRTLREGFMHTFRGNTAHIYGTYCHGKKRPVLKDQPCVPHAVRVKYFASPWRQR